MLDSNGNLSGLFSKMDSLPSRVLGFSGERGTLVVDGGWLMDRWLMDDFCAVSPGAIVLQPRMRSECCVQDVIDTYRHSRINGDSWKLTRDWPANAPRTECCNIIRHVAAADRPNAR